MIRKKQNAQVEGHPLPPSVLEALLQQAKDCLKKVFMDAESFRFSFCIQEKRLICDTDTFSAPFEIAAPSLSKEMLQGRKKRLVLARSITKSLQLHLEDYLGCDPQFESLSAQIRAPLFQQSVSVYLTAYWGPSEEAF